MSSSIDVPQHTVMSHWWWRSQWNICPTFSTSIRGSPRRKVGLIPSIMKMKSSDRKWKLNPESKRENLQRKRCIDLVSFGIFPETPCLTWQSRTIDSSSLASFPNLLTKPRKRGGLPDTSSDNLGKRSTLVFLAVWDTWAVVPISRLIIVLAQRDGRFSDDFAIFA